MASNSHASEASPAGTMKALTHTKAGLPSQVLRLSYNLPIPILTSPTDVLVKISHAGLNPAACIVTQLVPMTFRTSPSIPETDFSGTVVSTGKGVPASRELVKGAKVFGSIPIGKLVLHGRGALAEYVVVPAEHLVLMPKGLASEEAAGLSVPGFTALSVMDLARVKRGERVLVNGASGGIGCLVVQMAKEAVGDEGRVFAICSGRNEELVKGLGADEVIDYQAHAPVWNYLSQRFGVEPFDAILDCRGVQELFIHCPKYLKEGKPFVNVGPAPADYGVWAMLATIGYIISNTLWPTWLGGVNRPYLGAKGFSNLTDLERLSKLVAEGRLRVPIDSVWDLKDALKAFEIVSSRHARGKVIVKM